MQKEQIWSTNLMTCILWSLGSRPTSLQHWQACARHQERHKHRYDRQHSKGVQESSIKKRPLGDWGFSQQNQMKRATELFGIQIGNFDIRDPEKLHWLMRWGIAVFRERRRCLITIWRRVCSLCRGTEDIRVAENIFVIRCTKSFMMSIFAKLCYL